MDFVSLPGISESSNGPTSSEGHGADGRPPGPVATKDEIEKNLNNAAKLATHLAHSDAAEGFPGYSIPAGKHKLTPMRHHPAAKMTNSAKLSRAFANELQICSYCSAQIWLHRLLGRRIPGHGRDGRSRPRAPLLIGAPEFLLGAV